MEVRLFLVAGALSLFVCAADAALITLHEDLAGGSPVVDGVLGAHEYGPNNAYAFDGGGSGFGGQLGDATLYMKSDATHLYWAFADLGVPTDGNQYIIYFNTSPGGHQTNGEMNDTADAGRRNASLLSLNGTDAVTFDDGVTTARPDFALVFNNRAPGSGGFSALFELAPWGQSHALIPHAQAGLGQSVVEFSVPLTALGIAPGAVIDVAVFNISDTGFLSNEGLPEPGVGVNPGFGDGQSNTFPDFHRFITRSVGPQVGWGPRVANETLTMPLYPPADPENEYVIEDALGGFPFNQPMAIRSVTGETNRLFVAERPGVIVAITNLVSPNRTEYLNISSVVNTSGEGGLLSFDFHPDYPNNGHLFVYYALSTTTPGGSGFHLRLSRFTVSASNPNWVDPASEVVLFTQYHRRQNHNGGDVHFRGDGYLYISLGDEGGSNDPYDNGQRIDGGFFSSVMRIDVDEQPGSLAPNPHPAIAGTTTNYMIPPDNPFIGATSFNSESVNPNEVRTEIYAIGLRNPFRMAFDPVTDELYVADVGQGAREEINLIEKGGNYGWKWREGTIATPGIGTPPPGFTNWLDPILEYTHGNATNQGRSVTGGVVYRGDRLPELVGHYLFGDYVNGHVWSLTHNGTSATSFNWLGNTPNIVGFGTDPRNGDILIASLTGNRVRRLARAPVTGDVLPPTLSQAGVFFDRQELIPYAGIVGYDLNVPFWSDRALKYRWFSLPDLADTIQFAPEGPWTFPDGTVWIKHFDLELVEGDPDSTRRLETRLLIKNDSGAGGYGVTYRWGASTDDAVLVPASGLDETFVIESAGGVLYTQVWRYPSRAECLACHQPGAGFALGFNTAQLHRDHVQAGVETNQLLAMSTYGYLNTNVADRIHRLRALAHPTNELYSVEYRARSYIQANCASCHFPGGPALGSWDARIDRGLSLTGIIDGSLANDQGNPANRVLVPDAVDLSMLHTRIASLGGDRMPPVGSSVLDAEGVDLIVDWITELADYQTYAQWQQTHFQSTTHPDAQPGADPDEDGASNWLEYLTGTDPTDEDDYWHIAMQIDEATPAIEFTRIANRGFDVQYSTNLLDGTGWRSLNVPGNRPLYSGTTQPALVLDPAAGQATTRYYRVRVYEP